MGKQLKKKKKIAILLTSSLSVGRGAEVFVRELVLRLKADFEVTVCSKDKTSELTKKIFCIERTNPIVNYIFHRNEWLGNLMEKYFLNPGQFESLTFSLFALPHLLLNDYDLIFPINGVWGAMVCRIIRFIKGTPFLCVSQGGIEPPVLKQRPNAYVATKPSIFRWVKSYFPEMNIVLIGNGVNTEKFTPVIEPVKLPLERPIYLCVAAFFPVKRIELTIKAVSCLKRGSLLIIGASGPLEDKLRRSGRALLGERFQIIKDIPYDKMPNFYTAADVFTLPTADEPFGNVYIEAMASGLPVVAPDDEDRRFIINGAGLLCDVENESIYSSTLQRAAKTKFKGIVKQARKFSWEKIYKLYKDFFEDCLNK